MGLVAGCRVRVGFALPPPLCVGFFGFFFKFITYSDPQIWESRGEEPMMSLIKYCHSLLLKVITVNKGEEKYLFRRPFK